VLGDAALGESAITSSMTFNTSRTFAGDVPA